VAAAVCAVLFSGCTRVDRQLFEGLTHTRDVLAADVPARVDLARYRELVGGFKSELAAARSRAQTSAERAVLRSYEDALPGLLDLLAVWEVKERDHVELLPLKEPLYQRLQKEYDLPVNSNEPPSIYAGEAMPAIWDATKAKLEKAGPQ
jgi:hypothetical protein